MVQSTSGFARTWATAVFFLKTHRKATAVAVLIILGLILVFQNTHTVRTYLFFWSLKMPLIVWAALCAGLGYLGGKGVEWAYQKRRRRQTRGTLLTEDSTAEKGESAD